MARRLLVVASILLAVLVAGAMVVRWLVNPDAIRAAVERQATAALGQPVKVGEVGWAVSVRPRVVLTAVEVGAPPAITVNRVELTTGLRGLLSRRVEHGAVRISGGRLVLPLPISLRASGTAPAPSASPSADTDTGSGFTIVSVDRISLEDIDLVVGDRHVRLDVESSLDGDRLAVSRFHLQSGRTTVGGQGEFSSVAARRGVFSASADPLELDEMLALASGFSGRGDTGRPVSGEPRPAPMDVRVDCTAARGRLAGMAFTSFATRLALHGDEITMAPLTANVLDGTLTGRVRVDTQSVPPVASVSARVARVDVSQLVALAGQAGVLTGRLAGDIELRAEAGNAALVYRTAAGTGRIEITDGTAPYLDLVGPVILAFGRPDPSSPAQRSKSFSRLGGTFALAGGVLTSRDLTMTSRDVDLRGQGSVGLPGGRVDISADLVLSDALSAQAGRDLIRYASEGSHVVLPATITGSLASPSVSIDMRAAMQRAARNALSGQLKKELGRLFKK